MTDQNIASAQRSGPSRRTFLIGSGAAVLVGAGGGVAAAALGPAPHRPAPPEPPALLIAALAAEQSLMASIKASTGGGSTVQANLALVLADHEEHARVLQALIDNSVGNATPRSAAASPGTAPAPPPQTLAQLATGEQRASAAAAERGAQLTGQQATLLAAISACEATHAALLS